MRDPEPDALLEEAYENAQSPLTGADLEDSGDDPDEWEFEGGEPEICEI